MTLLRNVAIIVAALACNLRAQTVVVNNNLAVALDSRIPSANYAGTIWQDAAKTNPTSIWFKYDGTNITLVATNADEGSDWYRVQPGDAFTKANVEAGMFPAIKFSPVTVGGRDFWLGVSTGLSTAPNSRTIFGWAHLIPFGQLTMLENAVSYNSPGIIVGTTTVVPEPATITTAICAILLCLVSRRGRSN